MKCNVAVQLALLVILSPVASPTTFDAPHPQIPSRRLHVTPSRHVKEAFVFDRVPRNLIVSAARSVPRMDVVYKLVSAQEIVTMDSTALEASVPLVACEMLNAQLARLVLKANALILARSCNADQMQFVKHLDTEPYVYVPKDSNEMLEQADVEKPNAREMLIVQKIDDVTTMVCVSTHANNLAFVAEMLNVAQEITERNALAQLDL